MRRDHSFKSRRMRGISGSHVYMRDKCSPRPEYDVLSLSKLCSINFEVDRGTGKPIDGKASSSRVRIAGLARFIKVQRALSQRALAIPRKLLRRQCLKLTKHWRDFDARNLPLKRTCGTGISGSQKETRSFFLPVAPRAFKLVLYARDPNLWI